MVHSFITSCWTYSCDEFASSIPTPDIAKAASIYDDYCGLNELAATITPASSTAGDEARGSAGELTASSV